MADQRITELTLLTEADVNALDVLPIVDISASETKKVRAKDLFEAGATLADSGSIDIIKLNQSSATKLATVAIADDAITAAKLADDSSINYGPTEPTTTNFEGRGHVSSTTKYLKVFDGSVYQQVIAPTAGIEDLAVTTGKIAANAVTTAKVDASGLAAAAIATDAVTTAKINALAVTEAKIAAGAVTEAKIADDAITAAKIATNAVGALELADDAVDTGSIVNSAVTEAKIGTDAVSTAKIVALAVTTGKLAAGAVTTAKIDAGAVTATEIAIDAVTTVKIIDDAVTYAKIQNVTATDTLLGRVTAAAGNIEEITCTAAGRALLDDADATAQRTTLGLGTIAAQSAAAIAVTGGTLSGITSLTSTSSTLSNVTITSGSVTGITDITVADGGTGASNATTARTNLGVAIGSDVQAFDAGLQSIAGLTTSANQLIYTTASDTYDATGLTSYARSILDDADAATARTTLGLGTLATQTGTVSGTHSGTSSGSNTGDQTITLTGDVTGTGTGSFAASIATNAVITAKIADSNVTTAKINAAAVTGAKLAASSSTVVSGNAPTGSGEFTGQQWINTNTKLVYVWDGSAWLQQAGVQSFVFTDTSPLAFSSTIDSAGVATITSGLDTQTAATIFSGPTTGSAAAPTFRSLIASDLPVATASVNGVMQPGTGLTVTGGGVLNHVNSATPGTFTKVTIDAQGHASSGTTLVAGDIPNLDATKITTGSLDIARIAANTVTASKIANYAVTKIGDTQPTADHIGEFFFNPLSRDLFLWDGNVYQPIGISVGEIVFAGTYDASLGSGTGLISSVTVEGTAIGLAIGQALPAPAAGNNRYYLVVAEGGTITTGNAPHVALAPPDILLSNGITWTELDVSQTITAQTANNISFTPAGSIVSVNVQTAIQELDGNKLPIAGGTITGNLEIGAAGSLSFEGSTTNDFETFIAVVDPTADRTITLPNVTGTVITTGDTGTVTSTMLLNGTILDADINASAAIVDTKLATIATAGKVSNSATTATNANTASAIVARDASGNFTAGTITAALTGNASTVTTNANLTGHVTSVGNAAVLGSFTSAQLLAALTDETGTGAAVFATSPTFVTPALGTPSSGTLTNCTGLPIGGLTASTSTALGVGSIELGNASDTTLSRSAAGVLAVEGVVIPSISSTSTLTNKTLTDPAIIGTILEDVFTITASGTFGVDPGNGSIQLITLSGNSIPTCNFAAGESITLMVDDGTAYTITWTDATWGTGGVIWKGGTAPTLATTGFSVIQFWKVSTQVYGASVGDVAS